MQHNSTIEQGTFATLIKSAVQLCGGSESKLARKTGYSQNAVWTAKRRGSVSPEMAKRIEVATKGRVQAAQLRPDIFGPLEAT